MKRQRLKVVEQMRSNTARHQSKRRTLHAYVEEGKYAALKQYAKRHRTTVTEIITQMLDSVQQLDQ